MMLANRSIVFELFIIKEPSAGRLFLDNVPTGD